MMERTGMSVFLMLCTLNFINIETDDENQKYYSELLRESIQKAVRKGDFYTRYNIQQYLVMLIGITQENCTLVSKRINKEFNKRLTRRKNVSIDYYVASLGEVSNREQILEQRGSIDTLAVYVRYRQSATWQGSVYHMKNNEREDFNSELDLLKIIENCQNSTKNVAESG